MCYKFIILKLVCADLQIIKSINSTIKSNLVNQLILKKLKWIFNNSKSKIHKSVDRQSVETFLDTYVGFWSLLSIANDCKIQVGGTHLLLNIINNLSAWARIISY